MSLRYSSLILFVLNFLADRTNAHMHHTWYYLETSIRGNDHDTGMYIKYPTRRTFYMRKELRKGDDGRIKFQLIKQTECEEVTVLELEHYRVRRLHLVSVVFSGVARLFGTQGE